MSFLSAEPQSRVVLESHSKHILAQFDTQLGIVANRYLAFFKERRSIERTYANSLRELHSKAETLDTSFDPRAEPTTTRAAWDAVRENLKKEVDTQQAFVDILRNDVIKPLTRLKESNDETRRRIKKGLNVTTTEYADHAESKISELQRAYLKKYHPQQDTQSTEVVPNKRFGGKISTLFRGRREDAISEEVFDYDCRVAVSFLNQYRSTRVERLRDGYDCLEQLVFTTTVKDVLVKFMDGMVIACAKYDSMAKSTRAEVEKALAGTDMSYLKATFRRDLSFSIPPLILYRNYRPGAYSNLIFGVPLVDVTTNEDNVPKVVRMCIEEVEKRGLNGHNIYYWPDGWQAWPAEVLQLRQRFENETSFSFDSTDNINFVAMLLKLFLVRLPEPLFMLSLQDYRQYKQSKAGYTEDGFSLLRLKIRELNPVQRATLGALLRHLLGVSSHSDKNTTTVKSLAAQFWYSVLRGGSDWQDDINAKNLVIMEDLIQNAHTLFAEGLSPSEPAPSPNVADTTSTFTYGSLFTSPDLPQQAEVEAMGSTTRHGPVLFGDFLTSTQSSSSSLPTESRLTPPTRTALLNPLPGFPSSKTPAGVERATQEQVISAGRGPKPVEILANGTPAGVMFVQPTSVDQWRLQVSQSRLPPEAQTSPRSPPESVLYSISDFPRSSATSLQTGMGGFSL